jgi:hypothetical protein
MHKVSALCKSLNQICCLPEIAISPVYSDRSNRLQAAILQALAAVVCSTRRPVDKSFEPRSRAALRVSIALAVAASSCGEAQASRRGFPLASLRRRKSLSSSHCDVCSAMVYRHIFATKCQKASLITTKR